MNLEELRKYKPQIMEVAEKYGVTNIRVFGSTARGDATDDSDVDFLVEMKKGRSAFDMGGFYEDTREIIGSDIDLVTPTSLHSYIKKKVFDESIAL